MKWQQELTQGDGPAAERAAAAAPAIEVLDSEGGSPSKSDAETQPGQLAEAMEQSKKDYQAKKHQEDEEASSMQKALDLSREEAIRSGINPVDLEDWRSATACGHKDKPRPADSQAARKSKPMHHP